MKIVLKITGFILLLFVAMVVFVQSCATADLRTETVKTHPDEEKGRRLLREAFDAHGGKNWQDLETYEIKLHDQYFGFMGKMGNPYPGNEATLLLQYIPNSYNGRAIFQKGKKKGEVWGLQAWKSYLQKPGGDLIFKHDKDIEFLLPTYQYFIELPIRIQKATVVSYAGEDTMEGKTYDLVFATWNKAQPQRGVDQYVLWINRQTKLIDRVDFTVRDFFNFLKGTLHYEDYRDIDGLKIPFFMPAENKMGKGNLHEMKIIDVKFNPFEKDELLPDKSLRYIGDDKPQG